MVYPENIDRFQAKLNKKLDGSMYVIEEELPVTNGVYDGQLAHDNIVNTSLKVYTGSKYTGNQILNFIISIPSETPWKRYIRIFSNTEKVYVTYQTPGDTVEADDMNLVQDSITASQEALENYKNDMNIRLNPTESKLAGIASGAGTAGSATDAVIGNRTIDDTVTAASGADTPTRLWSKLGNMIKQITGKTAWYTSPAISLETVNTKFGTSGHSHNGTAGNGPKITSAGLAAGAVDDAAIGSRTVTDTTVPSTDTGVLTALLSGLGNMIKSITGKSSWRTAPSKNLEDLNNHMGAGDTAHAVTVANGAAGFMTGVDKAKLDTVALNANNYTHPSTHPASIITQDSSNRFVTDAEKSTWNGKQNALGFTPENAAKKGVANGYADLDVNGKIPDSRISATFVTQDQLGSSGNGDMLKSIYDTNNNGKVDSAEAADTVPWSGVSGKPSLFAPAVHKASHAAGGGDPLTPADIGAMSKGPLTWNQLMGV